MEKKKLLFVAISVGIFLVITIGAAILIFTPKNTTPPSPALGTGISAAPPFHGAPSNSVEAGNSGYTIVDPVNAVRNNEEVPGLKPYPEGTIPAGSDYHVNGSGNGTVITIPKPSTAAVPDAAPVGRASGTPQGATPALTLRPAPAAASAPSAAAKPAPAPKPAASPPKPAVQQTRVYNDFWVQTGAFSTIAKAEGVKETLSSKGITSIIENREVDGKTLFRVRVGPYTSQNEANYWLSLIKTIGGFEDSQVRQTQSRR